MNEYFKDYCEEIRTALNSNLYTVALVSALSLPDVCASLESPNMFEEKGVSVRYQQWYNKYAKKHCLISSYLCYKYRCSMVHTCSSHEKNKVSKIAFLIPGSTNCAMSNCEVDITLNTPEGAVSEKAVVIDIVEFVNGMIKSVEDWLEISKSNKNFIKNYPFFIQKRPGSPLELICGGTFIY